MCRGLIRKKRSSKSLYSYFSTMFSNNAEEAQGWFGNKSCLTELSSGILEVVKKWRSQGLTSSFDGAGKGTSVASMAHYSVEVLE